MLQIIPDNGTTLITNDSLSLSTNATYVFWHLPTFQITSDMTGQMNIMLTAYNDLTIVDAIFTIEVETEGETESRAARSTLNYQLH